MFKVSVMPEFLYRASMNAEMLKSMDPRICEDDDQATPFMIRYIAFSGVIMSVIYGLIPGMIVLGLVGVLVFFWAVKNGQYDDMEGPAHRILDDDDLEQPQHQNANDDPHKPS